MKNNSLRINKNLNIYCICFPKKDNLLKQLFWYLIWIRQIKLFKKKVNSYKLNEKGQPLKNAKGGFIKEKISIVDELRKWEKHYGLDVYYWSKKYENYPSFKLNKLSNEKISELRTINVNFKEFLDKLNIKNFYNNNKEENISKIDDLINDLKNIKIRIYFNNLKKKDKSIPSEFIKSYKFPKNLQFERYLTKIWDKKGKITKQDIDKYKEKNKSNKEDGFVLDYYKFKDYSIFWNIQNNEDEISFELDQKGFEYFNLFINENYAKVDLQALWGFKNKYTNNLYLYFLTIANNKQENISTSKRYLDLRQMLNIDKGKYVNYNSFKNKILNSCLTEINDKSNLIINLKKTETKRTINSKYKLLHFNVKYNKFNRKNNSFNDDNEEFKVAKL